MARVIVLGGTGFVGRWVCAEFVARGWDVLAVARTRAPVPAGVRLVRLDVAATTADVLARLVTGAGPDVVVNAAGQVWDLDEELVLRSNVTLVERMLAALEKCPIRTVLVHLGSSIEYGPQARGVAVREDLVARPVSGYGAAKLRATELVLDAFARGHVRGAVLRLCQVIGPGQPSQSLLGRVVGGLLAAEPVTLGPLRDERDFVDVRDVATAVVKAAEVAPDRVVNIGRGSVTRVRALVDGLIAIAGVKTEVVERESPAGRRSAGIAWEQADISLARDLLGWSASRAVEQTLRDLWLAASSAHRGHLQPLARN
ncbi:NAD-dependent epimerase/dehydratase family protein [Amycolatopsis sp. cg5]|uniref:NAD-dependent epimerase/dehydratase family protein n=1 Tax=Amycolatopsis sp. cg5 TaxID=3238802 RepID=UPI003525ED63